LVDGKNRKITRPKYITVFRYRRRP